MKIYLAVFIGLFSTHQGLCNGQSVSSGMIGNAAEALVGLGLFGQDVEKTEDLTAVAKLVKGITFDVFNENISWRVQRVSLKDYQQL
jgi:hypothetical protein